MSLKEAQSQIITNMKQWKKIENASVASTGRIIEKTDNPIVRLVMEIIQRDSQMHYRVQEMIAESLESKVLSLTPEELGTVWEMIEEHVRLEKKTIELAKDSLQAVGKAKGMLVQAYLIEYLLKDEEKHEEILAKLEKIKGGMYPYA
jgi:rubrerythrin